MIMAAIKAFSLLSAAWRWGIIVGALTGLLVLYGVWHQKVYQSGVDDTIAKIAANDARLVERAFKARGKLKACQSQGSAWDQSTGECR